MSDIDSHPPHTEGRPSPPAHNSMRILMRILGRIPIRPAFALDLTQGMFNSTPTPPCDYPSTQSVPDSETVGV